MTDQEIFNKVVRHLMTQNARSFDSRAGACQYRRYGGLKCAIGCLISDEAYGPEIEGHNASSRIVMKRLKQSGIEVESPRTLDLLEELQRVHDIVPVENWRAELKCVASDWCLTMPQDAA